MGKGYHVGEKERWTSRRPNPTPPPPGGFDVGDLVLVKMPRHPNWPAIIEDPQLGIKKPRKGQFLVVFYGPKHEQACVYPTVMTKFSLEMMRATIVEKIEGIPDTCASKKRLGLKAAFLEMLVVVDERASSLALQKKEDIPMADLIAAAWMARDKDVKARKDEVESKKLVQGVMNTLMSSHHTERQLKLLRGQALECAKIGYAKLIIDFVMQVLESAIDAADKVGYLYSLQYLAKYENEDEADAVSIYQKLIESRISSICDIALNHSLTTDKCLKVFTIWRNGKIFSGEALSKHIIKLKAAKAAAVKPPAAQPETPVAAQPETPAAPQPETPVAAPQPETPTAAPQPETPVAAPQPETPTAAPQPETPIATQPETPIAAQSIDVPISH